MSASLDQYSDMSWDMAFVPRASGRNDGGRKLNANFEKQPTRKTTTIVPFRRQFPAEIMEMIWLECLPGERVIRIKHKSVPRASGRGLIYAVETLLPTTSTPRLPTPLLHVNKYTRSVICRDYQPQFKGQFGGKPMFINFDLDTFLFETQRDVDAMAGSTTPIVRYSRGNLKCFDPEELTWEPLLKHVIFCELYTADHWLNHAANLERLGGLETIKIGRPEDISENNAYAQVLCKRRMEQLFDKEVQKGKRASVPQIEFMLYGDIEEKLAN